MEMGYTNNAWKKYQPGKPSDLTTFEHGYGYWIKMTNTAGWGSKKYCGKGRKGGSMKIFRIHY